MERATEARLIELCTDEETGRQLLALALHTANEVFPAEEHRYHEHELAHSLVRRWSKAVETRAGIRHGEREQSADFLRSFARESSVTSPASRMRGRLWMLPRPVGAGGRSRV